jgi:hypothetical protein
MPGCDVRMSRMQRRPQRVADRAPGGLAARAARFAALAILVLAGCTGARTPGTDAERTGAIDDAAGTDAVPGRDVGAISEAAAGSGQNLAQDLSGLHLGDAYVALPPEAAADPPVLAALAGNQRAREGQADVARFAETPNGMAVITVTRVAYADPGGAVAAYNTWQSEIGFAAAAERTLLDVGDRAERFDMGWPPLHAVAARAGTRFVLVEAAEGVPDAARAALLGDLARQALGPGAGE